MYKITLMLFFPFLEIYLILKLSKISQRLFLLFHLKLFLHKLFLFLLLLSFFIKSLLIKFFSMKLSLTHFLSFVCLFQQWLLPLIVYLLPLDLTQIGSLGNSDSDVFSIVLFLLSSFQLLLSWLNLF